MLLSNPRLIVLSALAVLALTGYRANADEIPAHFDEQPIAAPVPATDDDFAGWVRDLGSDSFRTRRLAMRELLSAGSRSVPHVAKAAESDDLELATRCVDILKTLYQSDNATAKSAAEEALNKLAKSERPSVAERAAEAVKPVQPAVPDFPGGGIRIQFGGFGGVQGRNVQIKSSNVNGNREIDVNIDGKKIHITDVNGKDIVVKVTEGPAGKEKTEEYKAKDLEELKKKHPEAAKLYEQYASGNNGIGAAVFGGQIQINGGFPRALPFGPPKIQIGPRRDPKQQAEAQKKIVAAQEKLNQAMQNLRDLTANGNVQPDDLKAASEGIQEAVKELQAAQLDLIRR